MFYSTLHPLPSIHALLKIGRPVWRGPSGHVLQAAIRPINSLLIRYLISFSKYSNDQLSVSSTASNIISILYWSLDRDLAPYTYAHIRNLPYSETRMTPFIRWCSISNYTIHSTIYSLIQCNNIYIYWISNPGRRYSRFSRAIKHIGRITYGRESCKS